MGISFFLAINIGGNILSENHSKMSPDPLKVEAWLDDWIKAKCQIQNQDSDDEKDDSNAEGTIPLGGMASN